MSYLKPAFFVALTLFGSVPAHACDTAEKARLSQEITRLASKNAWSGVERSYSLLLDTKCELGFEQYWLGAESARYLGKTYEQWDRLNQAKTLDAQQQVLDSLAAIEANYGRVDIHGDARRPPTLTRADMPFAPDQRKSIEWGAQVALATGSFKGMLPFGDYDVGGVKFTVAAGPDFQLVTVGKQRGSPAVASSTGSSPAPSESKGAINYAGPIVTIGPGFALTPAPSAAVSGANGVEVQPGSFSGAGVSAQLGGEIGLTYTQPEAGIALSAGYAGTYGGANTLHQVSGWLAGVLRPGQVRIALGPTYSFLYGKGQGVYTPFATGDAANLPVEQVDYSGYSWGAGVQGSVGYGVLDLDKLRGVVDLGGAWHSDGARSYVGIGLQFGIVPAVPRFKG
jgi:hypothetical protein